MIYYYKRKIEWNVSLYSTTKICDEIRSGAFDSYNIRGMKIGMIPAFEFASATSIFDECQIRYTEIIDIAKKLSSETWSFEVACNFEWKKRNLTVQHFAHYTVSIFFMGNAVDYISVYTADDLLKKVLLLEIKFSQFNNSTQYEFHADRMPYSVVFHNSAAATFAHEVLGHILEADNYYRYGYDSAIDLIRPLQIQIIDNPLIPQSPGFYIEDDMGIAAQRALIVENGMINTLIGCKKSDGLITNSLRRENYDNSCFPRMSNLIVGAPNVHTKNELSQYIQIDKLSKCFIYHNKKVVEFNVEFSFFHNNCIDIPLKPFRLKYGVSDLLSKVSLIDGGDMELRPIQCAKHNQVISCGASSPDWMVNHE